jgi:hypothetical protein
MSAGLLTEGVTTLTKAARANVEREIVYRDRKRKLDQRVAIGSGLCEILMGQITPRDGKVLGDKSLPEPIRAATEMST